MYQVNDKEKNIDLLNNQMLLKTLSMFEYENLPETIPQTVLERIIQTNGFCFIMEHDGSLYPFTGSLGGELDVYGEFTTITISNTALNINGQFNVKEDGVLISNDDLKIGLMPIFNKLNYMLVENDINMVMWGYNSRQQKIISASDDKTKLSADQYIKKIIGGDLSVIGDTPFLEGLTVHNSGSSSQTNVKEFLELHQYLKSNLLNEVGISSNFNMKKERLISSELDVGEDSLFPLVYAMMKNRIQGFNRVNEFFNLEIDVNFGSIWALKNKKLVDGVLDNEDIKPQGLVTDSDSIVDINFQQEEEQVDDLDGERDLSLDPDSETETNIETEVLENVAPETNTVGDETYNVEPDQAETEIEETYPEKDGDIKDGEEIEDEKE